MKNPCKQCIVLAICKSKFNDNISGTSLGIGVIAFSLLIRCELLSDYLHCADQDKINNVRDVYGLGPYVGW